MFRSRLVRITVRVRVRIRDRVRGRGRDRVGVSVRVRVRARARIRVRVRVRVGIGPEHSAAGGIAAHDAHPPTMQVDLVRGGVEGRGVGGGCEG